MHPIMTQMDYYIPLTASYSMKSPQPMFSALPRHRQSAHGTKAGAIYEEEEKENISNKYLLRGCTITEAKSAPRSPPQGIFLQSQYAPLVQVQEFSPEFCSKHITPSYRRSQHRPAPINRVPPEVLGDIFEFCLWDWNGVSVESLMAVCATWMGVCLGTPSLWTKVALHMTHWATPNLYERRSNYVYHHLCRSGILPMQVEINLVSRPGYGKSPKEHVRFAQAVLHLLFIGGPDNKSAAHWDSLLFAFNETTPRRLLDFLGTSMPSLRQLTINGPENIRLPVMQLSALQLLDRAGCSEPTGYSPANLTSLSLSIAAMDQFQVEHLESYQSLRKLNLTLEKTEHHLPKLHLPNLTSLEITIKYVPSSNSLQLITEEQASLRFLVLPHLHTLIVRGDNPSLIAASSLRNLNQVHRLELKDWEFLAMTSRHTKWGFLAHQVVQTPAMAWNPSGTVVEYLLCKCTNLVEIQGFPGAVKLVNRILHRRPDLRPCLQALQSKYQGVLRLVSIKGSDN